MKSGSVACSAEAKRSAMEAVLASRAFDRSDQLKRFLRYVCEMEIAGQGHELTEYSIGVAGLGRPESFSPNDDSIVRNRAYSVRKKLEEYYTLEAPEAPLRIDLPKGNYIPRFLGPALLEEEPAAAPSEFPDPGPSAFVPAAAPRSGLRPAMVALAVLAGVAVGAGGFWIAFGSRIRPEPPAALRGAWADLLRPGQTVLVSVATPPQAYIREFPTRNPPVPGLHPVQDSVVQWYRKQRPGSGDKILFEVPTFNSPLWGDSAGAFRVASLLREFGVTPELMAERLVTSPVFRNRNVVLFGSAEYSPAIARLMQKLPLQVGYDQTAQDHIAYEVDGSGAVIRRFPPKRDPVQSFLSEVYGLITVLPSEGDGERHSRYVIFSGISSAGTQAAAEYFASPSHLEALARRMNLKPGEPWPPRLQVLVHATTSLTVTLSFAYETRQLPK